MINDFNFKTFLSTVTSKSGVYRMYDVTGTVIYVGKAKNLKKRLSNYLNLKVNNEKTKVLVSHIYNIDVTITHTETEALLLEHNYIRFYQPRYNVLLRDDKSYPYIFLSEDTYPRLTIHHFNKNNKGEYFGPYPNIDAVRKTLNLIQKAFPLRQCKNSVYYNRSRPCLLYQIGRCLGPCITGLVSEKEYTQQVNYVKLFLSGKDDQIISQLVDRMENASTKLYFEEAAQIRDQIQAVRQITEKQFVDNKINDLDVIGVAYNFGIACLHVLFIRQGKLLGSRSYFPIVPIETNFSEVVQTFIGQYYLQESKAHTLPTNILLGFKLSEHNVLANLLKTITGRKVNIQYKPRGEYAHYLELANTNAATALATKLSQHITIQQRLNSLASFLKIDNINRIECFDVSHTMGEQTIASCVVFNTSGSLRSEYRRYNVNNITPSDDYAAISQALIRHYGNVLKKDQIPDVILIDGGKGQLRQAEQVIDKLEIFLNKKKPILLSIAKNNKRKLGMETIFLKSKSEGIFLPSNSPVLHIIQYIRNAAHNYAIECHRKKQLKVKNTSILEKIKGIGPKRRQKLLKYMGGLQLLMNSSIDEISKVPGISTILAKKIYHSLRLKH